MQNGSGMNLVHHDQVGDHDVIDLTQVDDELPFGTLFYDSGEEIIVSDDDDDDDDDDIIMDWFDETTHDLSKRFFVERVRPFLKLKGENGKCYCYHFKCDVPWYHVYIADQMLVFNTDDEMATDPTETGFEGLTENDLEQDLIMTRNLVKIYSDMLKREYAHKSLT
jgi:hypothetical protein